MREDNVLFKSLYRNVFYGGSYFDGLKVGKPEEFDLDLLLVLPKYAKPEITNSNLPGYVHLQLQELVKFLNQPEASRYPYGFFIYLISYRVEIIIYLMHTTERLQSVDRLT